MADVSAFARGYVDLIGSSDRGRGLGQAADFIQPTLDILNLLGANKRKLLVLPSLADITVPGGQADMTVPAGKVWRAHFFALSFIVQAAESITDFHLLLIPPEAADAASAGGSIPITAPQSFGPTPDGDLVWAANGFLLTPGTSLGHTCGAVTGGIRIVPRLYFEEIDV